MSRASVMNENLYRNVCLSCSSRRDLMRWMLHRQHANISHMQFNAFLFLQIFNLSLTADKGADDVSIHHLLPGHLSYSRWRHRSAVGLSAAAPAAPNVKIYVPLTSTNPPSSAPQRLVDYFCLSCSERFRRQQGS